MWREFLFKFRFIPRQTKFYELFEQATANLVVAAGKLLDLLDNYDNIEEKVARLKELEHEGDVITHEIILSLHRTFVTPIDREDIARLANSLDDVLDLIEAAGRACFLYHITKPTHRARELAAVILKVTHKLNDVMPLLQHRDKFNQILEECIEINRLENEADVIHHNALAELFDDSKDVFNVIKWREIYSHMESATDRAEDVANVLEAVVLKHA
jgi:predicted phosphate transport protein (TIGR00153 family)